MENLHAKKSVSIARGGLSERAGNLSLPLLRPIPPLRLTLRFGGVFALFAVFALLKNNMKSELKHLLSKLKTEHPDFQNIVISHNGVSMACLQHGYLRFETLDALEAYAWPQSETVGSPASAPAPKALETSGYIDAKLP